MCFGCQRCQCEVSYQSVSWVFESNVSFPMAAFRIFSLLSVYSSLDNGLLFILLGMRWAFSICFAQIFSLLFVKLAGLTQWICLIITFITGALTGQLYARLFLQVLLPYGPCFFRLHAHCAQNFILFDLWDFFAVWAESHILGRICICFSRHLLVKVILIKILKVL